MNLPIILASYPRSGSTWMRFILSNLFHPEVDHDFDSVNKHIPPIDYAPGLLEGIKEPYFFKTHGLTTASNVIYLYRHVGDVLISEFHYKRKMHADKRSLEGFLEECDYGQEWRAHVDYYFPAVKNVGYGEIGLVGTYRDLPFIVTGPSEETDIKAALNLSCFSKMRKLEERGFGSYETGDPSIPFCREGTSGQWHGLTPDLQRVILEKNATQLKMLGYT
jgi:estrone sulfotransferase